MRDDSHLRNMSSEVVSDQKNQRAGESSTVAAALGQGDTFLPMGQEFGGSGWFGGTQQPKHVPDTYKTRVPEGVLDIFYFFKK